MKWVHAERNIESDSVRVREGDGRMDWQSEVEWSNVVRGEEERNPSI